jgi:hypothetical protein
MPKKIPNATLDLLLSGEPWTAYETHRLVLGATGKSLEAARRASVASSLVASLSKELLAWPGKPLASHKSADQCFHKLALAAELGLRRGDPDADAIADLVMRRTSPEGPFELGMAIGEAQGGSGEELGAWALCDAPVILRALVRMGYGKDGRVAKAGSHLVGLSMGSGWPCAVSASLGSFRGPGKKGDPCPYATLAMIELLLELPGAADSELAAGADRLLSLWENSKKEHPYIFWMGDDFRKLKAPLYWYDLVHVLDALTRLPSARGDPRCASMLDVLESKAGRGMLFVPEAVYLAWKGYDIGQKKAPSPWLSAIALGILARAGRVEA